MSLNQNIAPMRGQDLSRTHGETRSRVWPGHPTTWTVALTGVYADGTYSFLFNGTLVTGTVTGTDFAGVIEALLAEAEGLALVFGVAEGSASGATLTLASRNLEQDFTLTTPVAPGGVTMTLSDITGSLTALRPGLAVALDDNNNLRRLKTGDTVRLIFGVAQVNEELDSATGDADEVDQWSEGSMVTVRTKGEIPVAVEEAVTTLDAEVWARVNAPGSEEVGAFRVTDAGGGNTVQLTNARWTKKSFTGGDGGLTAIVLINQT